LNFFFSQVRQGFYTNFKSFVPSLQ
jgi:hypothetical protein